MERRLKFLRRAAAVFLYEPIPDNWYLLTEPARWEFIRENRAPHFEDTDPKQVWDLIDAHCKAMIRDFAEIELGDGEINSTIFRPQASEAYLTAPLPDEFDEWDHETRIAWVEGHTRVGFEKHSAGTLIDKIEELQNKLWKEHGGPVIGYRDMSRRLERINRYIHERSSFLREFGRGQISIIDVEKMLERFLSLTRGN